MTAVALLNGRPLLRLLTGSPSLIVACLFRSPADSKAARLAAPNHTQKANADSNHHGHYIGILVTNAIDWGHCSHADHKKVSALRSSYGIAASCWIPLRLNSQSKSPRVGLILSEGERRLWLHCVRKVWASACLTYGSFEISSRNLMPVVCLCMHFN